MTDSQTLGGDEKEKKVFLGDEEKLFEYFGALKRSAGAILGQGGIEKCAGLHINTAGTLLAAQSTGKIVEVSVETPYLTILLFSPLSSSTDSGSHYVFKLLPLFSSSLFFLSYASLLSYFEQIYRLRDDTEAKKKMKRRQKRIREKIEKDKEKFKSNKDLVTGLRSASTVMT